MKKIKLNIGPLKLKREEISKLTNLELKQVVGGSENLDTLYPCVQSYGANACPTQGATVIGSLPSASCPGATSHHC